MSWLTFAPKATSTLVFVDPPDSSIARNTATLMAVMTQTTSVRGTARGAVGSATVCGVASAGGSAPVYRLGVFGSDMVPNIAYGSDQAPRNFPSKRSH